MGHDLTKRDLPVDATSFCRAMFIDMADNQPITAQPNAMLTRPFFQDGCPQPLKISWTNSTVTKNKANVSDPEKHMFLHAFYDALSAIQCMPALLLGLWQCCLVMRIGHPPGRSCCLYHSSRAGTYNNKKQSRCLILQDHIKHYT